MSVKFKPLVVGAIVIAVVGTLVYLQRPNNPIGVPKTADGVYSRAEIAMHDGASSCWTIIEATVYDLTEWIDQHPGGRMNILEICGTDGSARFRAQHGSQKLQADILKEFKVGTIGE